MRELMTREEVDEVLNDECQYLTLIYELGSGQIRMWNFKDIAKKSRENAELFLKDLGKDYAKFIATDVNY